MIPTLPQFDGIFFDTYGEFYEDLRVFHEEVPCLLKPGGIYSFFNGLGASTNAFFHTVYCRLVDMELKQFGIKTEYVAVDIDPSDTKIWAGVTRKYWVLTQYNLPICLMEPKDGEMETLAKVVMDAEVTGAAESQDSKEKAEE